jgi:hypothetical protein
MAIEELKLSKDLKTLNEETNKHYKKFNELKEISEMYYVYNSVA